jgi:hypothetical protein
LTKISHRHEEIPGNISQNKRELKEETWVLNKRL